MTQENLIFGSFAFVSDMHSVMQFVGVTGLLKGAVKATCDNEMGEN